MSELGYAAVLGRNAALSIAELAAVGLEPQPLTREVVRIAAAPSKYLVLGGTVKVVRLFGGPVESVTDAVTALAATAEPTGKFRFGISVYGNAAPGRLAGSAKRALKDRGVSSGFVQATAPLNLAQVKHNGLIGKGAEWCLFETPEGWYAGQTEWIPDFEGFARRDFAKPASDTTRGMLPPQVARAMVNLGTEGDPTRRVLDPFCGTGNLLLEAIELGHRTTGSDVSETAVDQARRNLEWLGTGTWDVAALDATRIAGLQADAIVTEGYLGQPVRSDTPERAIRREAESITELLLEFFKQAGHVLEPGRRLVITFPAWRLREKVLRLPLVDRILALGYTVIRPVPDGFSPPELTDRGSIDVARPKQRVVHELMLFERS